MTYTNIIPEAERMTRERAEELAYKEGLYVSYFDALAKRIQMTEPKPVDPALEAFKAAINNSSSPEHFMTEFRAELAKRGLKIGPIDGEEG